MTLYVSLIAQHGGTVKPDAERQDIPVMVPDRSAASFQFALSQAMRRYRALWNAAEVRHLGTY
jgi:hypothetical protein